MAQTVPHILLTVHGGLPGGEQWTCGLRSYHTPTTLSPTSGAALAVAAATAWNSFRTANPQLFGGIAGSSATVDGVTVRELNNEGITTAQYEGASPANVVTAGFYVYAPNQCALTVTLLSARAGRTGKGRIYLPCLGVSSGNLAAGVIIPAIVTTFMAPMATLLNALNTALTTNFGSPLKLAVQSPKAAGEGDPLLPDGSYKGAVITGFKIGNVIDTQRRRRASIPEVYQTGVVA